jgi:hypothetical protein
LIQLILADQAHDLPCKAREGLAKHHEWDGEAGDDDPPMDAPLNRSHYLGSNLFGFDPGNQLGDAWELIDWGMLHEGGQ